MNKVLITKYLSSIKNDDLPIFGAVVINSNPSYGKGMLVVLTTTEPFNVSELSGAEILDDNKKLPITSTVIGNNMIRVTANSSKTMHLVFDDIKYKPVLTNTIQFYGGLVDLSILKYQSNISNIIIDKYSKSIGSLTDLPSGITSLNLGDNSLVTGNIKDLSRGITSLSLGHNSLVTGNIKDLPSGITSLSLGFSSITGTLESYAEKLYNTHKNDGKDFTLSAHTERTGVTFNGASADYLSTTTISDGKATVRKGGEQGNIIGTYDGTSWTYNS